MLRQEKEEKKTNNKQIGSEEGTEEPVILAIVGYRNFGNYDVFLKTVEEAIEEWGMPASIVSGGCRGADKMAERFARERGIEVKVLLPNKRLHPYGSSRFVVRDRKIAEMCTHMVAFPSELGKGTQHTIAFAQKLKKPVKLVFV